ncbi:hypothetical protein A2615_04965 [Candidatus Curtissbacteria bacterium RIFOXYD1_FULL_41_36]|uniref:ACT domain-containing protein n=1 Tax=Candidatus Curtissbacteria bacterium RIFOXYA1_FULL_41_14 TaxID=1797737 RepID=A0A1F5HBD7_9BACT|nr:MAG: Homoserine dehydrogenase [Candidatus Curtissbacteria bacterium GW2011_GWC2_41_21]OGE01355.1 MAG: hypothetical protein A2196_04360 [Candidatus Curtissbacteria bacterium RIFOXYA1_FULL_41_14]OGE08339.1 MAG: hypothetical protein A2615_04965 [Candidatus Curtissbacteria bacterium RIFOXYD1_FULL_41_36]OGE10095.1 MAG: hypothetical protein A2470_00580 [Candidatus Curtissbacteria bacterium RIFOXYC2_FULL_41_11]OGE12624.1 MAG: hypothetical protein A2305_00185 [Candidatus Curtissbacteria bacterium RI
MGLSERYRADALVANEKIIPIVDLLRNTIPPELAGGIQIPVGRGHSRKIFCSILNAAFGINLKPDQIDLNQARITERDHFFASQFDPIGYAVKRIAIARTGNNGLVAWIGPTLIRKNHPSAQAESKNLVYISTLKDSEKQGVSPIPDLDHDIQTSHYFRVRVKDKPLVLASLCQTLANSNLNICSLIQPEAKGGLAEIAFLLDSSPESNFQSAIATIRDLSTVVSVSSIFKVIGDPTTDISRQYPNQA